MACRIDKFAWSVRLAKTRSIATDLVSKGKIKLNGEQVKAARNVKLGDEVQVVKGTATFSYRIIQLLERRVGAKLVSDYIIDVTPQEELDKFESFRIAQQAYKHLGTGKPTKKQRRDIDDFLENW